MLVAPQTPRDALDGMSALLLVAWGVILFLPGETFLRPGGYANMAALAPEIIWAAAFLSIGIGQVVAGMTGSRWRRHVAFLASVAWGIPAVCFAWPLAPVHAPIIYGALSAAMAWSARSGAGGENIKHRRTGD